MLMPQTPEIFFHRKLLDKERAAPTTSQKKTKMKKMKARKRKNSTIKVFFCFHCSWEDASRSSRNLFSF